MLCCQVIATFSGSLCKEDVVAAWRWWVGLRSHEERVTQGMFCAFPCVLAILLTLVSQNGKGVDCLHLARGPTRSTPGSDGDHWRFTLGNILLPVPSTPVLILGHTWRALVSGRTDCHKLQLEAWPWRVGLSDAHRSVCFISLYLCIYKATPLPFQVLISFFFFHL